MQIGSKIKRLRLKRNLTQEELADRCELSKGFISQLENDLTSPSIETLDDIVQALGTSLKQFFADDDEQIVFRAEDHFVKEYDDCTIRWLVTNSQKNEMEPILVTLSPGGETDDDMPHEGEEFGYVISGISRQTRRTTSKTCRSATPCSSGCPAHLTFNNKILRGFTNERKNHRIYRRIKDIRQNSGR